MTNNNFVGSKESREVTNSLESKSLIFLEYINETVELSEKMTKDYSLECENSDGAILVPKDFLLKLIEYLRTLSIESKGLIEEFIDLQRNSKFMKSDVTEELSKGGN